jgi:hypothetical protein
MPRHPDIARRHPIAFFFILLLLGPYILAACVLFIVFYVLAVALDTLGGRR